jgi:hypothetical protein
MSWLGGVVLGVRAMRSWSTATPRVVKNRPDARAGGLALLRSELAKRLPNDLLEGGDTIWDLCESAFGVALSETQAPERLKGFRTHVSSCGADDAAVGRAVRVAETRRGSRPRDDEPAPVDSEVMGTAKREQIFGLVVAAF